MPDPAVPPTPVPPDITPPLLGEADVPTPPTDFPIKTPEPQVGVVIDHPWQPPPIIPPPIDLNAPVPPAPTVPAQPPVNTTAPYVSQTAEVLNCTMGEWAGEPTAYAYQWHSSGPLTGPGDNANYTVLPADIGETFTCLVTATNASGSNPGMLSNSVVAT